MDPLAIETLGMELPHTIRLTSPANPALPQNCFEWALGLPQDWLTGLASGD